MSEQEKNNMETPEADTAAENTAAETTAEEVNFTLTAEQMAQMEQVAKTAAELNDKYLRLAAEYDNYRKRTQREKEGIYGDAKMDTIKKFLSVYDNLERGVAQYAEGDAHRQGLELIAKQFMDVLAGLGVTEIEAKGKPFDPETMNAVMHIDDESLGENEVAQVFQAGFKMGDKVIRFAMVQVAN